MIACARHSGIGEGAMRTKLKKNLLFLMLYFSLSECLERVIISYIAALSYLEQWNAEWCMHSIQLFRQRLSEKVHATISKGIVGGFQFSVCQRSLKELERKAIEMCLRVLNESNKRRFDSCSRQEQCIDYIPYYLSGLSRAHFFWQPFSK